MNNDINTIGIEQQQSISQDSIDNTKTSESSLNSNSQVLKEALESTMPIDNNPYISKGVVKPKKSRTILIIAILAIIVVGIVVGIVFFFQRKLPTNGLLNSEKKITSKDIENYGIESIVRWGNLSLGVSYLIPKMSEEMPHNKSYVSSYLHGQKITWANYIGYNDMEYGEIYIEKSLEGHTNLNTLSVDINNEFNDDNTFDGEVDSNYKFNLQKIAINKKVKIDQINTVYFESEVKKDYVYVNKDKFIYYKYLGYCFEFDSSYFCVYGKISADENTDSQDIVEREDLLDKRLQFIVASFKTYNGESFNDLNENYNLGWLYNGYMLNKEYDELDVNEKQFILNLPKDYSYNEASIISDKRFGYEDNLDLSNWDGSLDSILDFYTSIPEYSYRFPFIVNNKNILEILKEKEETINGIKMKIYFGRYKLIFFDYIVLYTFVFDNKPYIFKFEYNYKLLNVFNHYLFLTQY